MTQATPEVLFTDAQRRARVLGDRSMQYAADGDVVRAVVSAFGADIATIQMATWESVMVTSLAPQQRFFTLAQSLTAALARAVAAGQPHQDAVAVVADARAVLLDELDAPLRAAAADRMPALDYLAGLPAPVSADYQRVRDSILSGSTPDAFAELRRSQSEQERRAGDTADGGGNTAAAIAHDYRAVLLGVEGYLVGSAHAAGDESLLTVLLRWDTVVASISTITSLPSERDAARQTVLATVAQALGPADAARLIDWLAR